MAFAWTCPEDGEEIVAGDTAALEDAVRAHYESNDGEDHAFALADFTDDGPVLTRPAGRFVEVPEEPAPEEPAPEEAQP